MFIPSPTRLPCCSPSSRQFFYPIYLLYQSMDAIKIQEEEEGKERKGEGKWKWKSSFIISSARSHRITPPNSLNFEFLEEEQGRNLTIVGFAEWNKWNGAIYILLQIQEWILPQFSLNSDFWQYGILFFSAQVHILVCLFLKWNIFTLVLVQDRKFIRFYCIHPNILQLTLL